jgi:hypothetical protein
MSRQILTGGKSRPYTATRILPALWLSYAGKKVVMVFQQSDPSTQSSLRLGLLFPGIIAAFRMVTGEKRLTSREKQWKADDLELLLAPWLASGSGTDGSGPSIKTRASVSRVLLSLSSSNRSFHHQLSTKQQPCY